MKASIGVLRIIEIVAAALAAIAWLRSARVQLPTIERTLESIEQTAVLSEALQIAAQYAAWGAMLTAIAVAAMAIGSLLSWRVSSRT